MSIQGAMLNALSSLAAEQRAAALISNNVSNAQTPGYVRRDMPRSENLVAGQGAGVATGVTQRAGDAVLAAASRSADGASAFASRMQSLLETYTSAIGQPADERSLSSLLGSLKEALTTLSAAPDNAVAQTQALSAAQDLVAGLQDMDAAVSNVRTQADLGISRDVAAVNTSLDKLQEIEQKLAQASARGASTAEFEDQRETLLADLSQKLPLRIYNNGPGKLIVMTDGGTTLFDSGTVHKLSFTHVPEIPSDVRHGGTAPYTDGLSDITVDGRVLRISESGSLAAGLKMRDETMPKFADMLDQVAGQLAVTFQESDTSLTGLQAGLFTRDGSATFDPSQPFVGMARTIGINTQVDPEQGGALWRMRDGMQATAEGNASDNTGILGWLNAMDATRTYDTSGGLPGSMNLSQAASQAIGLMQGERAIWTDRATTRSSLALQARTDLVNKTAVNVDEELSRLMMVQQTYSASVQIIQAASKMLEELSTIR
ncbi:flagellar hook-associated protein FlgK [Acetobacteraceae bacterium AT-5844]|nr:flagellar hook-associated protein FlgK [Acetobacteraceae bacterium AT-5844]